MKTKLSLSILFGLRKTFGSNVSTIFILMIFFALCPLPCALSQIPQGFNYQAIVRDGVTKQPIISQSIKVRITIETSLAAEVYQEEHLLSTDEFGIMAIVIGNGTPTGTDLFGDIDWNEEPLFLKTELQYPVGSSYTEMGTAPLMSVPYAMVADSLSRPLTKLTVTGETTDMEEALFEVRNKDGQLVFAVYNEGVRIYVDDGSKGPKGGFAIGGFSTGKTPSQPYLIVNPDTVRIYINQTGKGVKGGFAIGGYGTDKTDPQNFLFVSDDSVRVYVDNADEETPKGVKGGFAIGGYGTSKGDQKFLTVSDDSVRIYINDTGKSSKGGFAIGGFGTTKGVGASFLNVETSATGIIDPAVNRILWYPLKNAFLTGKVLIESPTDVGENSFATGFESKAKGMYSQAMGYKAFANGDYSTAIGKNALANNNSFAFGDSAIAVGIGSIALGSIARDPITDKPYGVSTLASGNYSLALGFADSSIAYGAVSIGMLNSARGQNSMAMGYKSVSKKSNSIAIGLRAISDNGATAIGTDAKATGNNAVALGYNSQAQGNTSFAVGWLTVASNISATAIGNNCNATGQYSVAMGMANTASGDKSMALGNWSTASGNSATTLGWSTTAVGNASLAFGSSTQASSTNSTAWGSSTLSSGNNSTAWGSSTTASSLNSTSFGYQTNATGQHSTAIGYSTTSSAFASLVLGRYNVVAGSLTAWTSTDPVFVIGNGTLSVPHNAMTVLKNGEVYFPDVYADAVGATNQNLYIDNTGKIGFLSSSRRYKTDIEKIENIDWIYELQPVNFIYRNDNNRIKQYGLIAEDVEKVNPLLVSYNESGEAETVHYNALITPLLKAIQEQQEQIDRLEKLVEELMNK